MALPRRVVVGEPFLDSVIFSELVRIKDKDSRASMWVAVVIVCDEGGPASVFGQVGNPGVVIVLKLVHLLHEESVYFGLARPVERPEPHIGGSSLERFVEFCFSAVDVVCGYFDRRAFAWTT
jgi:hypothetical protein